MVIHLLFGQVTPEVIISKIFHYHGQFAMTEYDIADLYGLPLSTFRELLEPHRDLFDEEFAFQINTMEELQSISNRKGKIFGKFLPVQCFTEHGIYLMASILPDAFDYRIHQEILRIFAILQEAHS